MAESVIIPIDPKAGGSTNEPPPLSGWPWSEDIDPATGMPSTTPGGGSQTQTGPTPFDPFNGKWGILDDLKFFDTSPHETVGTVFDGFKKLYDATFGKVPVVGPISSGVAGAVGDAIKGGVGDWSAWIWYIVFGVLVLALLFFGVATLLKV